MKIFTRTGWAPPPGDRPCCCSGISLEELTETRPGHADMTSAAKNQGATLPRSPVKPFQEAGGRRAGGATVAATAWREPDT